MHNTSQPRGPRPHRERHVVLTVNKLWLGSCLPLTWTDLNSTGLLWSSGMAKPEHLRGAGEMWNLFLKSYMLSSPPFTTLVPRCTAINSSYSSSMEQLLPNHRIIESSRLEKTFKIIESNHKPNIAKSTTKPCP